MHFKTLVVRSQLDNVIWRCPPAAILTSRRLSPFDEMSSGGQTDSCDLSDQSSH